MDKSGAEVLFSAPIVHEKREEKWLIELTDFNYGNVIIPIGRARLLVLGTIIGSPREIHRGICGRNVFQSIAIAWVKM